MLLMKIAITAIFIILLSLLIYYYKMKNNQLVYKQEDIKMQQMREYTFLAEMYRDTYFPNKVVDMGKSILVKLCLDIENQQPKSLEALYELTHSATEKFNDLENVFYENESEIETVARECIAEDFFQIATAYGFEADAEELIATREW